MPADNDPGYVTITFPSTGRGFTARKRLNGKAEQAILTESRPPTEMPDGRYVRFYDFEQEAYAILVQLYIASDTVSTLDLPRTRQALDEYENFDDLKAAKLQAMVAMRPTYFTRVNPKTGEDEVENPEALPEGTDPNSSAASSDNSGTRQTPETAGSIS